MVCSVPEMGGELGGNDILGSTEVCFDVSLNL